MVSPGGRILLLISSLTGLPKCTIFFRQGFSAGIVMQQDVEDEVLYVLKIIRKDWEQGSESHDRIS